MAVVGVALGPTVASGSSRSAAPTWPRRPVSSYARALLPEQRDTVEEMQPACAGWGACATRAGEPARWQRPRRTRRWCRSGADIISRGWQRFSQLTRGDRAPSARTPIPTTDQGRGGSRADSRRISIRDGGRGRPRRGSDSANARGHTVASWWGPLFARASDTVAAWPEFVLLAGADLSPVVQGNPEDVGR